MPNDFREQDGEAGKQGPKIERNQHQAEAQQELPRTVPVLPRMESAFGAFLSCGHDFLMIIFGRPTIAVSLIIACADNIETGSGSHGRSLRMSTTYNFNFHPASRAYYACYWNPFVCLSH